jgi:putative CocE/NonD family hydrolase
MLQHQKDGGSAIGIISVRVSGAGAFVLAALLFCGQILAGADSVRSDFPIKIIEDKGDFTFYVNEEILVKDHFDWRVDGDFTSDYTMSMAGQSMTVSLEIHVNESGYWDSILMETPQGPVGISLRRDTIEIDVGGKASYLELKPKTLLFENFSPALMSQAVMAYDQELGGRQTFPIFIIPSIIMDGTLERLETVERSVMGKHQQFTLYRYGLPGVDVIVWADAENRVCYGDVPSQHGAYVRDGYEVLAVKEEPDSLLSKPIYDVILDDEVPVPMRDGIGLATDIYRPDADGKFPVVLVRTPYKKEMNEIQARFYARRGYVFAVQDCRGRFASPGQWEPFFNEPKDGYDAIEWLAVQPWSNGKVGMIGASYLGWVQWWAARENPPHLVTIIPNVSPPDPYFNIPYEYGAFFLLGAIWWADVLETEATADITQKTLLEISEKKYATLLRHLPVFELDSIVLGNKNEYWREWIQHPDNDKYWDRASFLKYLENLNIPVYHQSGWFDGDGIGSKLNYLAMAKYGHGYQKLVLGPWGHTAEATRLGRNDTDFGPNAIVDMQRSYMRWLDHWLLGIENGIDKEPMVSLFVMGSNEWLYGDKYPLPETRFTKFYLSSGGQANASSGDGRLSTEPASDGGAVSDTFSYDPGNPTPDPVLYFGSEDSTGEEKSDTAAAKSIEAERAKARAYYSEVDLERADILVYDSPPMDEAITIVGPISAVLYASTSAKDTDWFMRLSKVDEDDLVFPLVHGVIRARYRNSFSEPELIPDNRAYEYHLDMWQTGIAIPKGSRLRVEVASACFPTFSRNLNTGGHNETETEYIVARQVIYHDKDHPSHILLPIIPKSK